MHNIGCKYQPEDCRDRPRQCIEHCIVQRAMLTTGRAYLSQFIAYGTYCCIASCVTEVVAVLFVSLNCSRLINPNVTAANRAIVKAVYQCGMVGAKKTL